MSKGKQSDTYIDDGVKYISAEKLAKMTGYSVSHIRDRARGGSGAVRRGEILPHIKVGRRVFFHFDTVRLELFPAEQHTQEQDSAKNVSGDSKTRAGKQNKKAPKRVSEFIDDSDDEEVDWPDGIEV